LQHSWENDNTHVILARNRKGKNPLEKRRCGRWDNIKVDFKQQMSEGVDWLQLAQDRDTTMSLRGPHHVSPPTGLLPRGSGVNHKIWLQIYV
jgi:hypothetical protein